MMKMKKATLVDKCFSKADFDAIEQAVKKAETGSCGEIAVELASHTRHWLEERLWYSFAVAVVFSLVSLYLTRRVDWGVYYNFTQATLLGIVGFALAFFVLGSWLKRESRRRAVVWNYALRRFSELRPTRGDTGVLILVSLDEEQAAIVADKGIASKLPAEHWDTPHAMIMEGMKKGEHAEGIISAIESIGEELSRHFPHRPDDIDELPNRPTVIDDH
jgi:putative membrane protein